MYRGGRGDKDVLSVVYTLLKATKEGCVRAIMMHMCGAGSGLINYTDSIFQLRNFLFVIKNAV